MNHVTLAPETIDGRDGFVVRLDGDHYADTSVDGQEGAECFAAYAAGMGEDFAYAIAEAMTSDARQHGQCFAAELTRVASNRYEGA
jgi:hypothetical protein